MVKLLNLSKVCYFKWTDLIYTWTKKTNTNVKASILIPLDMALTFI